MPTTSGIDVSRWQGAIDWPTVAAQGYRFAAARATVGDYYTDPSFDTNWQGARAAGLLVTAYHAVHPACGPGEQIARLSGALNGRASDLPLVLDVEIAAEQPPATVAQVVQGCAARVEAISGRKPIIYTAKWFWDPSVRRDPAWREYDLWIADYGETAPTLPVDWDDWTLWQYSETGTVAGVSSPAADLNWFNGSDDDLRAYCSKC